MCVCMYTQYIYIHNIYIYIIYTKFVYYPWLAGIISEILVVAFMLLVVEVCDTTLVIVSLDDSRDKSLDYNCTFGLYRDLGQNPGNSWKSTHSIFL